MRVEMDPSGRILRFAAAKLEPDLDLVSAGCYVVEPALCAHCPDDGPCGFEQHLFPLVLRKGGILAGHRIDGMCFELDSEAARTRAQGAFVGG